MFFKLKAALAVALLFASGAASAALCTLAVKDSTCTFTTDTSGGAALFTNPTQLSNIGSGVIAPFLGSQAIGTEFGVNTDQTKTNLLPLDDKRDNANTFTRTLQLDQLGTVTVGGTDYYEFFLDINEPNNDPDRFLSIDSLAIFGQTGATPSADIDINKNNVTSLADVDVFPNLDVVYRLGVTNTLILDYSLFAGSGLGYDLALLIPVTEFVNLATDSRLVFAVGYGGAGGTVAGSGAADGFEEWSAFINPNNPPPPPPPPVPEPATLALLAIGFLALAARARRPV